MDIPNINTKSEGDCGYVAGFSGKKVGIYTASLYAAKQKAVAHFKPRRSQEHMVWVLLAERADGSVVEQVAA